MRAGATSAGLALAAYLSIGWSLVNWWPHDNLHRVIGVDWPKLAGMEIGFHVTLIAAAIIIAFYFVRRCGERARRPKRYQEGRPKGRPPHFVCCRPSGCRRA